MPGNVWLDVPGNVRHVEEGQLEFTTEALLGQGG